MRAFLRDMVVGIRANSFNNPAMAEQADEAIRALEGVEGLVGRGAGAYAYVVKPVVSSDVADKAIEPATNILLSRNSDPAVAGARADSLAVILLSLAAEAEWPVPSGDSVSAAQELVRELSAEVLKSLVQAGLFGSQAAVPAPQDLHPVGLASELREPNRTNEQASSRQR